MKAIVILPFFLSSYFIYRKGIENAFLYSYLPCLLLIAPIYSWKITGLPDLAFTNMAFLPIFASTLVMYSHRYRPIFLDLIVIAFFSWEVIAEMQVAGLWAAQSVALTGFQGFIAPYFVARVLVGIKKLPVEKFIKVFVFLGFLNIFIELHSLIFGFSLQDRLFRSIFTGSSHGEWFLLRFGLPRLHGVFVHPILAGLFFAIAYRLHRWLQWNGMWEKRFKFWGLQWMKKESLIRVGLLFMLVMSLSRGPWLAATVAAFIASASLKVRPRAHLIVRTLLIGVLLFGFYDYLKTYSSGRFHTRLQASVSYRWDLKQRVQEYLDEKPIYGWGVRDWPVDINTAQSSIDNAFLYYAIKRGYIGEGLFILLLGWQLLSSFRRSFSVKCKTKTKNISLEITLFSIHLMVILCLGTVWIDAHLFQIYMIVSGFSGTVLSDSKPYSILSRVWQARQSENIPMTA